jgi:four helix bundle protein
MTRDYTKIRAWQLSHELALLVYEETRNFPKSEQYALTSQMRRAALSVPANIVEGSARKHRKEYLNFLYTSLSSLEELGYYIKFAKNTGYLKDSEDSLGQRCRATVKTLQALINHIERSAV